MTLPKSNLPNSSQPWGRAIESQLDSHTAAENQINLNLTSLTRQVNNIAQNQSYAIPTIYSNPSTFTVSTVLTNSIGQVNFNLQSNGFIFNLGFLATSNALGTNDYAYLYAKLYDSSGNDTGLLDANFWAKTIVNSITYFPASATIFIPTKPGLYTLKLYVMMSLPVATSVTYKNIFASIQPIPNS